MDNIWEAVFARNILSDPGANICYWVLYIPEYEIDEVWEHVCRLTMDDALGYRAAISPDVMEYGEHKGHFTIILDTPLARKDLVFVKLEENDLREYIIEWKVRRKFNHSP